MGFCFYLGPKVGWVHRNQGAGRDMWGHSNSYLGCPRFPRKEKFMGGASVVAYLEAVTHPAPCLRKMGFFEMDALAIRSLRPVS